MKLVKPLLTRHVEPWAEYIFGNREQEKAAPHDAADSVRKAVECGWFEDATDPAAVDDMPMKTVMEVSRQILAAFNEAMGIDEKNLSRRQQTTQTEQ